MTKELKPTRIALEVESEFRASHSLAGFEIPHFHLWKVRVEFEAKLPLADDRLIDLVHLQTVMDEILKPLSGTYLNESLGVSPTSENLALWVWEKLMHKLPDAPLSQVQIKLCDLEGVSTGSARVMR
jgi:6-pyruvoyl-tetrahydropterin synthase